MPVNRNDPLQTLLQLRQKIKQQREQQLAAAVAQLGQREEEQALAQAQLEREQTLWHEARRFNPGTGLQARDLDGQARYVQRLAVRVADAAAQVETVRLRTRETQHLLLEARQALRQATAELQVVEKEQAAWHHARRREEQQRAERELDELLLNRWSAGHEL